MMMQLHVLGPAFGLPSIDAECNAAVALVRQHFGADDNHSWEIVATHEHERTLPCLRDGERSYCGFNAIARHLSPSSTADETALSSFLQTQAPLVLAISLYVNATNYRLTTRPAFTAILPWHANYILPPSRRAVARRQTEHLGISSIDVDNVHEDMSGREGAGITAGVGKQEGEGFEAKTRERASLLLGRKETLQGLLRRPERAAVFRLHALADNFFEPLVAMLDESDEGFAGSNGDLRAVECLAYGYLALMLKPQVEQDWLARTMKQKYARLVNFVNSMHGKLGLETRVKDVVNLAHCKTEEDVIGRRKALGLRLPWCPPANTSAVETATTIVRELAYQVPYFNPGPTVRPLDNGIYRSTWQQHLPAILIGTLASLALGTYAAVHTGLLVWPHGDTVQVFGRKRLADYGHLGAALSGLSLLGAQASRDQAYHDQGQLDSGPVEVDVVVDGEVVGR